MPLPTITSFVLLIVSPFEAPGFLHRGQAVGRRDLSYLLHATLRSASLPALTAARRTTSPTTTMAGLPRPDCATAPTTLPREVITLRWLARVPSCTTATGIASLIPAPRNPATMSGRRVMPM